MPEFAEEYYSLTPVAALESGETVKHSFRADRATYIRDHAWMAAAAMAGGMLILWLIGNPHIWTGAIGGLAAIAVRAFYLASDELKVRWDLTDRRLLGPQARVVLLRDIRAIKVLGSAVQVVTTTGDKHLLKYQDKRDETRQRLLEAMAGQKT